MNVMEGVAKKAKPKAKAQIPRWGIAQEGEWSTDDAKDKSRCAACMVGHRNYEGLLELGFNARFKGSFELCPFCAPYFVEHFKLPLPAVPIIESDKGLLCLWYRFADSVVQWHANAHAHNALPKIRAADALPEALAAWMLGDWSGGAVNAMRKGDGGLKEHVLEHLWQVLIMEQVFTRIEAAYAFAQDSSSYQYSHTDAKQVKAIVARPDVKPVWELYLIANYASLVQAKR